MRVEIDRIGWDAGDSAIVDDVTATLEAGSFTAVVGPNGSGKTTLLHLVAGLRRPARGEVRYDGKPLRDLPARERARSTALLEQQPDTSLELSVRDVVALGRIPHVGRWPGALDEGAQLVPAAMREADVVHLAHRTWSTLSGGERQRTQLARALAQQPRLLLLDEPTNHLDLQHQLSLLETVARQGITTMAVLHDLDLAAAFCPRIIVMSQGRVAASGDTEAVLTAGLVDTVFGVCATVERTDRLRISWSRQGAGR
ncbi:ABC transporter ATP-binding protein [Flexivirga sp. ID2601S]|uniref:ABC transporter ATP-binding protein n=1 Tax=Flexivirga aerilata TaxID=1656889 RepID=A0A849AGX8_9MICO|nr:ABC transporter ATP-binding protein [Flexivirga aerilata]NNG38531.1 ABC transporter ATP-binding protein [Flexivirga aerilata]